MIHFHHVVPLVGSYDEEFKKGMIGVEAWTTIRYLHAQGTGIREMARELSIARNTVRSALKQEEPPRYVRTTRPEEELDRYEREIRRMYLEQDFIGSRIFRELNNPGYRGKKTAPHDLATLLTNQTPVFTKRRCMIRPRQHFTLVSRGRTPTMRSPTGLTDGRQQDG